MSERAMMVKCSVLGALAATLLAAGCARQIRPEPAAPRGAESRAVANPGEPPGPRLSHVVESNPLPAAPPAPRARVAEASVALAKGLKIWQGGDALQARQAVVQVVARYPQSVEAVEARIVLARDALVRGDLRGARGLVESVRAVREPEVEFNRRMVLAEAAEREGDWQVAADSYEGAVAVKATLASGGEPGSLRQAVIGATRSVFVSGRPDEAEAFARAHGVGAEQSARPDGRSGEGEDSGSIRAAVQSIVSPAMVGETLGGLYRGMPRDSRWFAWVALRYAEEACARAEFGPCLEAAELAGARADGGAAADWQARARSLLGVLKQWNEVQPLHVGVLLPLSGRFKGIGEAAKRAIEMALASVRSHRPKNLRLIFADTEGDPAVAAAQARRLILEEHVVALLGPVGHKESSAAVEVSARFAVPHGLLSSHEDVARRSELAIRLRLSPGEQARAIARFAATDLKAARVGILYPDDRAGQRLMMAFWDEVLRLGGEVYAVEAYAADTKDFHGSLKALLATDAPGKGDHGFDALFIPDGARTIRRLLPFLKYWGLPLRTTPGAGTGVQLLGAAGWNHRGVIDRGDNLSDNAVFVDAFFHDPDDAAADGFARQWFQTYGAPPRTFHAEVYDGARLLLEAVALSASPVAGGAVASANPDVSGAVVIGDGGVGDGFRSVGATVRSAGDHRSRGQVYARLLATRQFQGATGLWTVMADGTVARRPRVLTIDLDTIRGRLGETEERAIRGQRFVGEGSEE